MDNEEELLIHALFILIIGIYVLKIRISRYWTNREYWVRPINMNCFHQGDFNYLFQEIKKDPCMFFCYTRMSVPIFNQLLEMMKPVLTKKVIEH